MNPWTIIGWLCLCVFVIFPVTFVATAVLLAAIKDAKHNKIARRAHRGKLPCQDMPDRAVLPCPNLAVRQTPNGFFCNDHWSAHSRKRTSPGGSISYAHLLDYVKNTRGEA